ncbi:hypothetical protein P691DRAFT_760721 [Macrolepiota fuliginosa MF-IS2]|uniref:Uncharacterized protein n=1 Tax=Macrolepiota fuliginosa MF-IS2 TaxID=1400762 RepID=A0A9P5XC05_9AGAR|nr:hypothetical protein P691DRAFT_760721 [Macrolepiota fuliginosa MF-IS2]
MSAGSPCHHNADKGLIVLPPCKSSVTREDVKFTTLAGRYTRRTVAQPLSLYAPLAPLLSASLLTSTATPWSSSSSQFSGIITLQDPSIAPSSTNPYAQREFPAETYAQVKRHVKYMVEHPHEKTLGYKVGFPTSFLVTLLLDYNTCFDPSFSLASEMSLAAILYVPNGR